MNIIDENGIWFIPNEPERKIYGRLTFSPDKSPKLDLLDTLKNQVLESKTSGEIPSHSNFDVINGTLVSGKKATLCYCRQPFSLKTGIQTCEIYAKYLIIGFHFKSTSEIILKGVFVRYKNLEEWVNLLNFNISWETNDKNNQVSELNIKQSTLAPIELGKLNGFDFTLLDIPANLQYLQMLAFLKTSGRKVTLGEKKQISIIAENEQNLEDFILAIGSFQDLVTFASGQISYPTHIKSVVISKETKINIPNDLIFKTVTGHIEPESIAESDRGYSLGFFGKDIKAIEEEVEEPVQIEIYFHFSDLDSINREFDSRLVLFDFQDIKDEISKILNKWEVNSKNLQSIIEIYLRLTYIPERHINDFFLSLAQAIEALHRLIYPGHYIDKKIHKKIVLSKIREAIDSIPDDIPIENGDDLDLREYKKILKEEKLSHLNSYSLRDRLSELSQKCSNCLPENLFTDSVQQEEFFNLVRKNRNSLTHLTSDSNKSATTSKELLKLSRKLKIVLEACLLKFLLEIEDSKTKYILSKHR